MLLLSVFAVSSCDNEIANMRYKPDFGKVEEWEEGEKVELKTGVTDAFLRLDHERRAFRYFMPDNLKDEGVGIVFYFHGHMVYMPDNPYNPVGGFNEYDPFSVIAKTENLIIVHPVGSIVADLGMFGWNDQELNARFFDKMVAYFKEGCPALDMNKIYVTGTSSGGIFSYGLAELRSEVIAAACPVAAQYSIGENFKKPSKVVPIRTYVGTDDKIVDWQSAYDNHFMWANSVAGCKKENAEYDHTTIIINRWYEYDVEVTRWLGGGAPMEFYKVIGVGHNDMDMSSVWEFMKANPKE